MNYSLIELFAGIRGFSLAFEAEGFTTIGASEIDEDKNIVANYWYPEVPNFGDINAEDFYDRIRATCKSVDVLTAGFPCQPFSIIGQRVGLQDPRFTWYRLLETIGRIRPKFGVLENVPGLLSIGAPSVGLRCWDNRWGRLYHDLHSQKEIPDRGGNGGDGSKGTTGDRLDATGVWRTYLSLSEEERQPCGPDLLEDSWNEGHWIPENDCPLSDFEEAAGGSSYETRIQSKGHGAGVSDSNLERQRQSSTDMGDGTAQSGRVFGRILRDLASIGYDGFWQIIPAAAFGSGHLRERVILVIADSNNARLQGHAGDGPARGEPATSAQRPTAPCDLRGRVDRADWWYEANTGIPVLASGLSSKLVEASARCAGDAIVPQVVQPIARAIKAALDTMNLPA